MPKKKKKPTHKAKKKAARPAKKKGGKAATRKRKPPKKQTRASGNVTLEFAEIDVITGVEDDSMDDAESSVAEPLDEHFPPDYGGSE